MKTILQTEASECALACLAMVADHFGYRCELGDLRRRFAVSLKGATMTQLVRHAATLEFSARPLSLELDEVPELQLPCILHWDLKHFVVLKKVHKSLAGAISVTLVDPAVGERKMAVATMSKHFTGVALELSPNQHFKQADETKQISVSQLTGKILGLRSALVQVFCLAAVLELFAISAPLFNQYVIDDVIVAGDRELLIVLTAGFALLTVAQTAIELARSWFLMRWSIDIGFQWVSRVFTHMLRLPVAYFEKRRLGDIVSRFGSIAEIQGTLTTVCVGSVLDGIMALLALAIMFAYSVYLSAIVIAGVAVYTLLRWCFYQPFREASQEQLILGAKESSHFFETIRAMSPIKLFGRDAERRSRWLNLKQDVINRAVKTQKLGIMFKVANTALFSAQGLAIFYVGAGLVMSNALTIGMLMAFSSYAATFSGRIFSLIDVVFSVRLLSMHTGRLADIVMEEAEQEVESEIDCGHLDAEITLRGVKFRYGDGEPWVLDGIDLSIPGGQSLALVGPSGCGKSTLCKIILGLLKPTEGEVLLGGIPVSRIGYRAYRQVVGTVMQDDTLLAGSILENITFFDAQADIALAEQCARLAAVHDEIRAMPTGYQTLVGEMGSTLSGGQKQRVLLARALYKRPRILALDEATSHLDVANEQKVNVALGALPLTRIMVAHRPETINAAERIVAIQGGRAFEVIRNHVGHQRMATECA
jgi:ATP-binding cassette subfamily B protein RaxB